MKHIQVLDCTLRDGGYVVNTMFGHKTIKGIINKLSNAKIDVIECGFLKDSEHANGSSTFNTVEQIIPYIPKFKNNKTSFVAMVDYGRYDLNKLTNYDGKSIDAIRNCFFKKDRFDGIKFGKEIINKGYKIYIQPVDILGYTDKELLELVECVNELNPYAFAIVDTFGSMYKDDLLRLYSIIHHNLNKKIKLCFHSHNNMQLSFSLSQELANISLGQRDIIIDSSICGLGRGAGNTNTELVVDYLNRKLGYDYDMNELLDLIDIYMPKIINENKWGYSVPYFIAGMYSSHVHNITYLLDKHNIKSKDMRLIIENIDSEKIKRYDFDDLENIYSSYFNKKVDDAESLEELRTQFNDRQILLIAPGKSSETQKNKIQAYIDTNNPIIITVNSISEAFNADYAFYSNTRRYEHSMEYDDVTFSKINKIITSNIKTLENENEIILNFSLLIKKGWKYFDNSMILLLRLLDKLGVTTIAIAGFDGFDPHKNYNEFHSSLETYKSNHDYDMLNEEIQEMLIDFKINKTADTEILFVTDSLFQNIFK